MKRLPDSRRHDEMLQTGLWYRALLESRHTQLAAHLQPGALFHVLGAQTRGLWSTRYDQGQGCEDRIFNETTRQLIASGQLRQVKRSLDRQIKRQMCTPDLGPLG